MWEIVTAMRLAGDNEGKGECGKAMVTTMSVVGSKEGKGGKAMATALRVAGTSGEQRRQR